MLGFAWATVIKVFGVYMLAYVAVGIVASVRTLRKSRDGPREG
jgi:hypothetical protein